LPPVNVGGDESAAGDFHPVMARDLDVLADLGHGRNAVGFEIGRRIIRELLGDLLAERAEGFVAGDEVGFAIDLHEQAEFAVGLHVADDDAFFRVARGLLAGGGDTFLAQVVHGGIKTAVGFDERLLAVHETGAGDFAEFGDIRSREFSHNLPDSEFGVETWYQRRRGFPGKPRFAKE